MSCKLQGRSAQRELVETVISIASVTYAQFPPILNGYGGTVIRKIRKVDCVSRERILKKRKEDYNRESASKAKSIYYAKKRDQVREQRREYQRRLSPWTPTGSSITLITTPTADNH